MSALGIFAALSVTETGHEDLVVNSSVVECRVNIAKIPWYSFSVVLQQIFTPRTVFSRSSSLMF